MSDFDYKKYSLENLENWLHDAMSSDVTSNEIYDCIVNVVRDSYYHHKKYADEASELLTKLGSPLFEHTATGEKWTDFWEQSYLSGVTDTPEEASELRDQIEFIRQQGGYEWTPEVSKKKWILPVEQVHDDYFISFPDDLLEAANLKEGDEVNWIDNGDGSYKIEKVFRI